MGGGRDMKKAVGNILTNVIYKELHPVVPKSISEHNVDFVNETGCCPVRRQTLHTVMSDQ